jgi:hypothetical protein
MPQPAHRAAVRGSLRTQLDPVLVRAYLASAARIGRRRMGGHRRFTGDAGTIARACVDACWTGEYLAASGGHFRQFWTRDLGFAAPSLGRLDRLERLRASLEWALSAWAPAGHVTTTIFPGRRPRDVWTLGIDSMPMLLWAMSALKTADRRAADDLAERHRGWLVSDVARYGRAVLDPASGLVRDDRPFSSHRDTVRTRSNAYANAMLVVLDGVCRETGWCPSPVPDGARERFVEAFWRGDRFVDRTDASVVTGDATVAPFFFGVVPDELGLAAALAAARAAGLADPLPLRYAAQRDPALEDPVQRRLVPDYQGTAIWTSLGAMYLRLLQRADPSGDQTSATLAAFREVVERTGTVWEVFDGRARTVDALRPYVGRLGLFQADEAMLWSAILADAFDVMERAPAPPP